MPYATYPSVIMYDNHNNGKPVQHLLFGDYIKELNQQNGQWIKVKSRRVEGWVKDDQIQNDRILEVNFVDIGQGDGCHIVTPKDEHIVIDAGVGDNMYRYLSWRFNLRNQPDNFKMNITAIISHPDLDHYGGFSKIFEDKKLNIENVYHNGIVERANDISKLGPSNSISSFLGNRKLKHLSDIINTDQKCKALINNPLKRNDLKYLNTLLKAQVANQNVEFKMLSTDDEYIQGFEEGEKVELQVLGPVVVEDQGVKHLRYFTDDGKTKNGHSIILKLKIGTLCILLGGDLNYESENYLIRKYTGSNIDSLKKRMKKYPHKVQEYQKEIDDGVTEMNKKFGCEITKSCHHGSHHFIKEFLKSICPIATIISSGDNESYAHPRPDALGAIGKYGRGERPLIFSTELARSHKEIIKHPYQYRNNLNFFIEKLSDLGISQNDKEKYEKKLDYLLEKIERSVAIYGMINVRTDGEKVIIAQKLEKIRTGIYYSKWDIHEIIKNNNGEFEYKIKLPH